MTNYSRFIRKALDGASECLALVRFTAESRQYAGEFAVQVTSGPNVGDDFVGLFDIDGEEMNTAQAEWELVPAAEVPTDLADWELGWETGTTTVEAL
jgi:hypothetical protein